MADAGLKLGIDGEKDFKRALSEIKENMKTLGTEMKFVTSEFDANDKSVSALREKYRVMNESVEEQRKKVETLEQALNNASESFGENDKRTQSWKQQLNLAKAELNNLENALSDTKDELKDAENPFKRIKNAVSNVKTEFAESHPLTLKFATGIKDAAKAAAGFTVKSLKAAAVGATAALSGMAAAAIKAANDTAAAGDNIDKASQRVSMSREAYQEWDFILSQNGASIDGLETGMKKLITQITTATEKGGDAAGTFELLGISMDELQTMSPEETFEKVVAGLQGVEDETQKAALANELFGKSGVDLMPLLNATAEGTEKLKQEAHDLGMIMSDEAVDAAVSYTDAVDKMKRSFSGITRNISAELLPGFQKIVEGLTGLATGQDDATEKISEGVEDIVDRITEMLPMVIDVIAKVLPVIVRSLVEALPELLESLGKALKEMVSSIAQILKDNWPQLKEAGLELIKGLWEGIKDAGEWLKEKIKGFADGVVSNVKEFFGIHSPSTVFAGIGGFMAEGLGVGFEKQMQSVAKVMRESVPNRFESELDMITSYPSYGSRSFRSEYPQSSRRTLPQTVVLQVGEREFGRAVVEFGDEEYTRSGVKIRR